MCELKDGLPVGRGLGASQVVRLEQAGSSVGFGGE